MSSAAMGLYLQQVVIRENQENTIATKHFVFNLELLFSLHNSGTRSKRRNAVFNY
jgi:hypothetical protein